MKISILEWNVSARGGRQITLVDGFADCFASMGHSVKLYSNYFNKHIPQEEFLDYFLTKNLTLENFDFDRDIQRREVEEALIEEWSDGDMLLIPYPAYSWLGEYVSCPIVVWYIAEPVMFHPSYVAKIWTNSYTTKDKLDLKPATVIYAPHDYTPFREGAEPFDDRPIDVLIVGPLTKTREKEHLLSEEVKEAERLKEAGLNVLGLFLARSRNEVLLAKNLSFDFFLNIKRKHVAEFMKKSKVLFHPSPLESCSLVLYEALNAGMYPVVREAGACKEQLGDVGVVFNEFEDAKKHIEQTIKAGYDVKASVEQGLKFDRKNNLRVIEAELHNLRK